jgi:hypothetical protein
VRFRVPAIILTLGVAAAGMGIAASPAPSPAPSATATPTPAPQLSPELTGDAILIKAQLTTRQHRFPPFVTYQMHEIFDHHGQHLQFDYRVWYRGDGQGLMQNLSKDRFGRAETFFGRPFPIEPVANIILYATPAPRPPPPPSTSPLPLASGETPPPVLFSQPILGDRFYSVQLAGLEIIDGRPMFHLTMHALMDEVQHPLKDLWVDVVTFEVWKAHLAAHGSKGSMTGSIDAVSEFQPLEGYWVISHMVANGEGHFGIRLLGDSAHYEYTFSDFAFPSYVPDWYFDKQKFRHH